MKIYRLSSSKHSKDLSGKGAEKSGGRWNSKGTPMIYTAESRSLCTVEVAVHTPLGIVPLNYRLITIEIPDKLIHEFDMTNLPRDWDSFPHSNSTQIIGDQFVSTSKHLVLKVPSAAVPGDFNYLINPRHKDMSKVRIVATEKYSFDRRLFVKKPKV